MVEAAQTVAQQQATALATAQAAQAAAALAQQQIITAWVSAIAAAIQAVGAVAAIFFSVKLARDAEKREAAAERASVARAIEAEQAAARRIAEAAREEKLRQEAAARASYNQPLQAAEIYAAPVLRSLDEQIARAATADPIAFVRGSFNSPLRARLEEAITGLLAAPHPVEIVECLERLRTAAQAWESRSGSTSWAVYLERLVATRDGISAALDRTRVLQKAKPVDDQPSSPAVA